MNDKDRAIAAIERLAEKGRELAHRAHILRNEASNEFFREMTLESARSVQFWAEQLGRFGNSLCETKVQGSEDDLA